MAREGKARGQQAWTLGVACRPRPTRPVGAVPPAWPPRPVLTGRVSGAPALYSPASLSGATRVCTPPPPGEPGARFVARGVAGTGFWPEAPRPDSRHTCPSPLPETGPHLGGWGAGPAPCKETLGTRYDTDGPSPLVTSVTVVRGHPAERVAGSQDTCQDGDSVPSAMGQPRSRRVISRGREAGLRFPGVQTPSLVRPRPGALGTGGPVPSSLGPSPAPPALPAPAHQPCGGAVRVTPAAGGHGPALPTRDTPGPHLLPPPPASLVPSCPPSFCSGVDVGAG